MATGIKREKEGDDARHSVNERHRLGFYQRITICKPFLISVQAV